MTSKEILRNALAHQDGPIPIDLGATSVTGIHCQTLADLRDYLGLEKRPVVINEPFQMLGQVDDDVIQALGIDVLPLWSEQTMVGFPLRDFKPWRTPWGQEVLVPGQFHTTTDDKGATYLYAQGDTSYPPALKMPATGRFFDATDRQKPYDEDNLSVADNTEEFQPIDDDSLEYLGKESQRLAGTKKGIVGSFGGTGFGDVGQIPGHALKDPKGIRGVADWYMLLASDPDFVKAIFDVQLERGLDNLKRIHQVVGNTADVCFVCGTDFGTQTGTFCSIETFQELFAPYYKAINRWIHENTTWKTFKHCCGSIFHLIPELIDSGFDILNPVQWSAANMDRQALKDTYGKHITFWGGAVNTQSTLPFGTPEQVYKETLDSCRIFGKGGGYVFHAIHNIQSKVPAENVVAMFKAVNDYNRG